MDCYWFDHIADNEALLWKKIDTVISPPFITEASPVTRDYSSLQVQDIDKYMNNFCSFLQMHILVTFDNN